MRPYKFKADQIKRIVKKEVNMMKNFSKYIPFVMDRLKDHTLIIEDIDKINLDDMKSLENEGKNYHWSVIQFEENRILIRRYDNHLTIYTNRPKLDSDSTYYNIHGFTFDTDLSDFSDDVQDYMNDIRYSRPFMDLELYLKELFELMAKGEENRFEFVEYEKYIRYQEVFCDGEYYSYDNMIFMSEELSRISRDLYAEQDMLSYLKDNVDILLGLEIKLVGDGTATVIDVNTDVEDDYYHNVGLKLQYTRKDSTKFLNVYRISEWYLDQVM